jgi:hypothetical protein
MNVSPDNSALYRSPDGYAKVIAHYDKTMANTGIKYQSEYVETCFGLTHVIVCGMKAEKRLFYGMDKTRMQRPGRGGCQHLLEITASMQSTQSVEWVRARQRGQTGKVQPMVNGRSS